MKLSYYPETDSLYIELNAGAAAKTRELEPGINIDLDAAGAIIGLDIDQASRRLDLSTLETVALPVTATRAA